jgi:hypothetical protein
MSGERPLSGIMVGISIARMPESNFIRFAASLPKPAKRKFREFSRLAVIPIAIIFGVPDQAKRLKWMELSLATSV